MRRSIMEAGTTVLLERLWDVRRICPSGHEFGCSSRRKQTFSDSPEPDRAFTNNEP